jgi:hypothetical protein
MQRKTLAVVILLLGLGVGVLAHVLFYDNVIGFSFPIFITAAIIVVLAASRLPQIGLSLRNLWPLIPAVFFAGMVAVRGDVTISMLNFTGTLMLCALALHYLPLRRSLDQASLGEQVFAVFMSSVNPLFMPFGELIDSWVWLREGRFKGGAFVPVIRGVFIALPILVVFALLLGSADPVFGSYFDNLWELFSFRGIDELIARLMFIAVFAWLAVGVISYGIGRRWAESEPAPKPAAKLARPAENEELPVIDVDDDEIDKPNPPKRKGQIIQLGMIETGIIMGSVTAMFAVFVLIQFAYFFGGEQAINSQGYTYAEYARRGFFELVAVSVLTLGLVLFMDNSTVRHGKQQVNIFRVLSVVIVALTGVMLFSASQRMLLYETAYGFTHLRVYTHVAMLWIGVLLVTAVLSVFRVKVNIFALGTLLTCIGYLGMLNAINVDYYIAERNIERYYNGDALDLGFLGQLSVDAAPVIIKFYQNEPEGSEGRTWAGQWLANVLSEQDLRLQNYDGSIFSAHLAKDNAWREINTLRAELPEYDPYFFYSGSSYDIYSRF